MLLLCAAILGLPDIAASQHATASVVPPGSPQVRLTTFQDPGGRALDGDVEVRTANVLFCREAGATLLLARDQRNEVTVACPFTLMVVLDGERLVVSLDEGEVYVESDRPTGVNAGDAMIGTGRTHYVVRREAEPEGGVDADRVSCAVFEGSVLMQVRGEVAAVEQGMAWAVRGNEISAEVVSATEYRRAAALYTRVAVEKTRATGAEVTQEHELRLRDGYMGVLREPEDPEARVRLKEAQVRGGFSVPATALEVVPPEALERNPDLSARLLAAEAVHAFRTGESERAVDLIRHGAAPAAAVVESLRGYETGHDAVAGAARRLRVQLGVVPP